MTSPSLWTDPPRPGYSLPNNETTQLTLSDLVFIHDDVGNPTAITDISTDYWPVGSKPVSRTFQYDSAYRITEAEYMHSADMHEAAFDAEARSKDRSPVAEVVGANRVEKQTFRNDWQGNTIFSDDNEKLRFDRSLGKISNGAGIDQEQRGPNQLIDAAGIHAEYDAAGNVVELTVARRICWDGMPECSHRFRYDWDEVDQLVQARRWDFPAGVVPDFDPNAVPVRDLRYVYGGGSRVLTSKTDGKTIARHKLDVFDTLRLVNVEYVPAYTDYNMKPENEVGFLGGVARVFYDAAGTLPRSGETPIHVFFNIVDHLGSSAFVIDKDSGEVVERTTYQAYGAVEADFRPSRWGAFRESFKFTGKEEDIEVGISYFGARYLNMRLGRWMSADPLTVHGLEGDLNPYAYVGGQVTNHIDPYGLSTCRDGTPDCQDVDVQGTPRKKDVDLHPVAEPMSQKDILRQMVNEQASHTPGGMLYKTIFTPIRDWLFPKRRKFLNAQQNVVESNAHQDHTDAVVALGKLAEIILQPLLPRPNVQPPGLEALSRAGKVIDTWDPVAKFLTRAGRALVKHQKGLRPGATKFSGVKGQPSAWNEAGQAHLDDILTNPASTTTTLGRGGLKVTAPDGRAARFNADGSFDGFVE